MPSSIYKGDLAEVSFAAETGITLEVGKIDTTTIKHTNQEIFLHLHLEEQVRLQQDHSNM